LHGIDFNDVWRIFENETATDVDNRFDYSETRYLTLGLLFGSVIVVVHTEINEIIRIISARNGNKYDEERYFREVRN
jgi:uncharacterized DUF497 family protein